MSTPTDYRLAADAVAALVEARHDDPFAVLGPHEAAGGVVIRALVPGADRVEVVEEATGAVVGDAGAPPRCRASSRACWPDRPAWFGYTLRAQQRRRHLGYPRPLPLRPVLGDLDDYLIREGTHRRLFDRLGAHPIEHEGVDGVHFAVWAPNAAAGLGGRRLQRLGRPPPPDAQARRTVGDLGDLRARHRRGRASTSSSSSAPTARCCRSRPIPFGFGAELRPATASVVAAPTDFTWGDAGASRDAGRSDQRARRRSRSTRCISAPGSAARTAAS